MKFLELPWGEDVLASTMERLPWRRACLGRTPSQGYPTTDRLPENFARLV